MLLESLRRRLKEQARRLDRLERAAPGRPADRLATYKADPAQLMLDSGFAPDPWQAQFLRSADPANLILCARQVGKSLVVSVLALHTALTRPGGLTVIVAQRQDQAAELLRKSVTAYYKVGSPAHLARVGATHFELATGSRILALPGEERAMHGPTADLLIIDEAARVPDPVFHAASPQLSASKGRLVALSTAFSKSGWFYREWTEGDGYRRWSVTARDCPRHTPAFLARERRAMGERAFGAACMNVFGDDVAAGFSSEDIDRAASDPTVLPLFPEFEARRDAGGEITPLFGCLS
jgi:hypothetical protein